jgi:hypothetical protein
MYDALHSRLVIRIQNSEGIYVEDFVTDEMRSNWPQNFELLLQAQTKFLQGLCDSWSDRTGEHILLIAPKHEGQEWGIEFDYLEGEVVGERWEDGSWKEISNR